MSRKGAGIDGLDHVRGQPGQFQQMGDVALGDALPLGQRLIEFTSPRIRARFQLSALCAALLSVVIVCSGGGLSSPVVMTNLKQVGICQ